MRLCKTARKLGVPTVAVYTAADIGSSHVRAADEYYAVDSYLDEAAIVAVAMKAAASAQPARSPPPSRSVQLPEPVPP